MADSPSSASVFTVAPGVAFLPLLAKAVLDGSLWTGPPLDAAGLADVSVLLPGRRAARALGTAFLEASGQNGILLPRIGTLGDLDDDETLFSFGAPGPAGVVSETERQIVLADIARQWAQRERPDTGVRGVGGVPRSSAEAAAFARDLARLLDAMETEEIDGAGLAGLLPAHLDHLARNWEINLDFLRHALDRWQAHLSRRGLASRIARRGRDADLLASRLRAEGSPHPVVAAGSTGSVPATARLLSAIARLSNGAVVLPGLDLHLDERSWRQLTPDHPQYGLMRLLEQLGVERDAVAVLGQADPRAETRAHLLSEVLRPAATAELWAERLRDLDAAAQTAVDALGGISLIEAAGEAEEARAVALAMRRTLEFEGRTAALVTPDRGLARRVEVELSRWGVWIDDSAGRPLAATPHGVFLRLLAEAVTTGLAPVPTAGLLKHPLARLGLSAGTARHAARFLELLALRGGRPGRGPAGLRGAMADAAATARSHPVTARLDGEDVALAGELVERLARATAPLEAIAGSGGEADAAELIAAIIEAAEAVAAPPPGEAAGLWNGSGGEALAGFLAELADASAHAGPIGTQNLSAWFEQLMAGRVVRTHRRETSRLFIWGPLEARLQRADMVILGALNEGTWPQIAETDPWLGRHMRAALGLSAPERRIGLQAHDFVECAMAPDVLLTRSAKAGGAPTVPSRWIWRLKAVAGGLGAADALGAGEPWLGWARGLDAAPASEPQGSPRPTPPVSLRPRQLSVTEIETWIRDPYAIYARRVLDLKPLEGIDLEPDARDSGNLIHHCLAELLTRHPVAPLPASALDDLFAIGESAFEILAHRPGLRAYWWMRFERIARWFVAADAEIRPNGTRSFAETRGRLEIGAPGLEPPFRLTARADRVDVDPDGSVRIYDYKTGGLPSAKEIKALLAPQLPLEAAILAAGGFDGPPAAMPRTLAYLRLTGRAPPGQREELPDPTRALAEEARARLAGLVAAFARQETPYASRILPRKEGIAGEFDHLARVKEWSLRTGKRHGG